jgi:hypothetical protein
LVGKNTGEKPVRRLEMKLTEDWLSVILAFGLMLLAVIGLISPALVTF